ncbi:nuclear pore complex protein NUP98A-like [Rhodamnia argentea]|uniref:Nuclear pore complex protein NUP98A-like n=1 Tax=Rhodamnia argentea TaxID=178133 RepID=A0ABM3H4W7_9MYRT|nr:nuclear pore complex protein NUP98A-like [Rhodamnia argentea]
MSHPSPPAVGSSIFHSSMPWGAQSQSVFRASSNPGSGSTTPAFGATSNPALGSTPTAAFGATSSPLFGSGGAIGASSNAAFGSSPPFGPSGTAFRSNRFGSGSYGAHIATPTVSGTEFGNSSSGGQPRGSRVAPFTPTEEEIGERLPSKLQSICRMPVYECRSQEELRWEDYQRGDKGSSPFGFTPAQTSTSGTASHPSPPTFGSSIFCSSMPWGARSQPRFRASSDPGSGSTTPAFGSTPTAAFAFGAPSSPIFGSGSTTPAFGSTSTTPNFGSTPTTAFAFGAPSSPIFGSGSTTPAFGSTPTAAFDATSATLFGSGGAFGASCSSSLSFGSSPAFGPSEIAFRSYQYGSGSYGAHVGSHAAPPTVSGTEFGNSSSGGRPRGSRVAPFTPTREEIGEWLSSKLQSICGMPVYECESHEEVRWEDYQMGDKGSSPFGFTPAQTSTSGIASHPSPPTFGSSIFCSSMPWGARSQPRFRASSDPGSGSTTPAFGSTSTTPAFGSTPTAAFAFGAPSSPIFGFGLTTPAFGSTSATPNFGSTPTTAFAFGAPSSPIFGSGSTTPAFGSTSTTPAFGSTSTTPAFGSTPMAAFAFGAPSSPIFGSGSTTPAFGSTSTTPNFGSTPTTAFAFGAPSSPIFGSGSTTLAFGSTPTTAFDATSATLFGSEGAFGASCSSSLSFGSSPAFGPSESAFRSYQCGSGSYGAHVATPTVGGTEFGNSSSGGQPRGSRVAPFTPIEEETGERLPSKLQSICGMPVYECRSQEELRWEDHQVGDKGTYEIDFDQLLCVILEWTKSRWSGRC